PEHLSAVVHHRGGRLKGITLRPIRWQKRKANIDVRQRVSFQQAANTNRRSALSQFHQVESEAKPLVAGQRASLNVTHGVGNASHFLVADVAQKRRLIKQVNHEIGVVNGELAKD